jgi:hypothetical protein
VKIEKYEVKRPYEEFWIVILEYSERLYDAILSVRVSGPQVGTFVVYVHSNVYLSVKQAEKKMQKRTIYQHRLISILKIEIQHDPFHQLHTPSMNVHERNHASQMSRRWEWKLQEDSHRTNCGTSLNKTFKSGVAPCRRYLFEFLSQRPSIVSENIART